MKIKHFGNVRLRTGNVDRSIGFTDSPFLKIIKGYGYIGEERRVTGVWENSGKTTVIGEILTIEFISTSGGRRYVRTGGEKIWGSLNQYRNQTEPK